MDQDVPHTKLDLARAKVELLSHEALYAADAARTYYCVSVPPAPLDPYGEGRVIYGAVGVGRAEAEAWLEKQRAAAGMLSHAIQAGAAPAVGDLTAEVVQQAVAAGGTVEYAGGDEVVVTQPPAAALEDRWHHLPDEPPAIGKTNGCWDTVPVNIALADGRVRGAFATNEGGDDGQPSTVPELRFTTDEGLPYYDVVAWRPMPAHPILRRRVGNPGGPRP